MTQATAELADRWERARRAALREVLAVSREEAATAPEASLQARALATDEAETYRRLFENGVRLGSGYARVHGGPVPLHALPALLARLGAPCASGALQWRDDEAAFTLSRGPCCAGATADRCDAWREAIDGLVVGLTDGARLARFESAGHGDARCTDFVYENPQSPARFGPLDDALGAAELALRERAQKLDPGARLRFLGVAENVLAYELEPSTARALGTLEQLVVQGLRRLRPTLQARRWHPRAPLSSPTTGCTESP